MNNINFATNLIDKINLITGSTDDKKIPVHEPDFINTNALEYVSDCISSGWVSSAGKFVNDFEDSVCSYTGSKFAIAVTNGTVALRLALYICGVKRGEEVILPPLSFVATANAISHLGAIPHFIDIENERLGLCPITLENRLKEISIIKDKKIYNKFTGRRIAAIVPVHVFGIPSRINEIKDISEKWHIPLVEDAAEALGSWETCENKLKHCGLFGDVSIISFNGNKIISTGGGGVLITNDPILAKKARHLSTTAKINHPWEFIHDEVGWNDRLPNINAALGLSQMEVIQERLKMKKILYEKYIQIIDPIEGVEIHKPPESCVSNNWLISIKLLDKSHSDLIAKRDMILSTAHKKNLLLRPSWNLLSTLQMYCKSPRGELKNAEDHAFRIINLPSSPQLLKNNFICYG